MTERPDQQSGNGETLLDGQHVALPVVLVPQFIERPTRDDSHRLTVAACIGMNYDPMDVGTASRSAMGSNQGLMMRHGHS